MFGLLTSLAMFACSGDKTTDTSSVSDTATNEGCGIELDDTYPVLNASDVYYLADLTVEFNDPDETASLTLVDSSGAEIAGEVTVDDDTLTFNPTDALLPSTAYTLNVSFCAGEAAIDFTTSALGTALDGGDDIIVGQTYALDISSGSFVEPAGVGDLIGGLLENNILIGVTSVEDSLMNIRGAISVASTTDQDMCTATLEEFPAADFTTSPYFEIPKENVTLSVAGFTATIYGLAVTGTFSADGTYFGGATLEGELDARQILPLLGDAGLDAETPEEVCGLLLGFGVQCVECQLDSEPLCVGLVVEKLTADATGVELMPVTEEDIAANAECAE
jgi:hypothetical protein